MFSRNKETKDFFKTMWHSSAHLLAYALEQYYGDDVHLLHGPAGDGIPYCFFYEVILDVLLLSQLNLREMRRVIRISRTSRRSSTNSFPRTLYLSTRLCFPFFVAICRSRKKTLFSCSLTTPSSRTSFANRRLRSLLVFGEVFIVGVQVRGLCGSLSWSAHPLIKVYFCAALVECE